jgi:hypothetical protein
LLLFEVESAKPATDAAMKRFHITAALKDQHVRSGWVQFAPGGIAIGPGCAVGRLSHSSDFESTIEEVLNQVASLQINLL